MSESQRKKQAFYVPQYGCRKVPVQRKKNRPEMARGKLRKRNVCGADLRKAQKIHCVEDDERDKNKQEHGTADQKLRRRQPLPANAVHAGEKQP